MSDREGCSSGGRIGRRRITTAQRVIATNGWHDVAAEEEDLETYCDAGVENEYDDREETCSFSFCLFNEQSSVDE